MSDYYIDNINLLISQRRLNKVLKVGDKIFVDNDSLIFVKKVLYGSYYGFRVEDFNNGSYCVTVAGKLSNEIYHNRDKMKNFLETCCSGYKNKIEEFKKENLKYPNKEMLIQDLYELDNSDYLNHIKEFLSFLNPEILREHESMFAEIIDSVN